MKSPRRKNVLVIRWLCHICVQDKWVYMNKIDEKVNAISETVENNKVEILSVKSSCDAHFSAFADKINEIENKYQNQIDEMKLKLLAYQNQNQIPSTIEHHNNDLTYMRNLQRRNNLIVQNVPIFQNETKQILKQTIIKLALACGYEINDSDIVLCIRLKQNQDSSTDNQKPSSNAILVKLADVSIKDELFNAYIKNINNNTPLTTSRVGLPGNKRIFINQHLSPELVKVKLKAVKLKQMHLIDKLTACYNVVKVYKNGKWEKVYTIQQLDQLMETSTVGSSGTRSTNNLPTTMHF
uniref:CSON012711 protein n=1 Tax=Culicoides sonorensis TaxID=179676 RepID=A0A336KMY8_CULSO